MMFDPLTLIAAIVPLLTEAGRAGVDIVNGKFATDEFKPSNIAEVVTLQEQQLKLFEAINSQGGQSYPLVEAIIRLQRPVVVLGVVLVWGYAHASGMADTSGVDNAAGIIGSYLFADRTLFHSRKAKN